MDANMSTVNWIDAYMEWTDVDSWTFGSDPLALDGFRDIGADASGVFAAAYLDWMDEWQLLYESSPHYHATASAGYPGGIDAYESGLDMLWDAFMVSLHTDSDCMPFLRQIIDAGNTTPRTVIPA